MSNMNTIRLLIEKGIKDGTLNLSELARATGVSRPTLYAISRGKAIPSLVAAEKIAEFFGLELKLECKEMVA